MGKVGEGIGGAFLNGGDHDIEEFVVPIKTVAPPDPAPAKTPGVTVTNLLTQAELDEAAFKKASKPSLQEISIYEMDTVPLTHFIMGADYAKEDGVKKVLSNPQADIKVAVGKDLSQQTYGAVLDFPAMLMETQIPFHHLEQKNGTVDKAQLAQAITDNLMSLLLDYATKHVKATVHKSLSGLD